MARLTVDHAVGQSDVDRPARRSSLVIGLRSRLWRPPRGFQQSRRRDQYGVRKEACG